MTRGEAAEIRAAQLMGQAVREDRLRRAISVLSRTGRRKWDLPTIHPEDRAAMNASLAFRLGLAIGACRANP